VENETKCNRWTRELDLMEQWYLCMTNIEKMLASCEVKIANIEECLEREV